MDHHILVAARIPVAAHTLVAADSSHRPDRADHLLRSVSDSQSAGGSDSRCLSLSLSSRRSSTFSFSLSRKPILLIVSIRAGMRVVQGNSAVVGRTFGRCRPNGGKRAVQWWNFEIGNNERRNVTSAGQDQTGRVMSWLDSVRPHLKLIRWQQQWGVNLTDNGHSLGSTRRPLETTMPRSTGPPVQTYISRSCRLHPQCDYPAA